MLPKIPAAIFIGLIIFGRNPWKHTADNGKLKNFKNLIISLKPYTSLVWFRISGDDYDD